MTDTTEGTFSIQLEYIPGNKAAYIFFPYQQKKNQEWSTKALTWSFLHAELHQLNQIPEGAT